MKYPTYLRFLDAFGALSAIAAVIYVRLPQNLRPVDHLDSLWGNLSTEMLGIWLSVRLIDWIIRSHESFTKSRVRIVRNMRMLERLLLGLVEFRRPYELKMLSRELKWVRERLNRRLRHLKVDEKNQVTEYFRYIDDIVLLLPDHKSIHPTDRFAIADLDRYLVLLDHLELLRLRAEENIFEETEEDDGI